jgi:hypothetical protein
VALRGESVAGDIAFRVAFAVEIRSRFRPLGDLAERGAATGDSGELDSDFTKSPPLGNETLVAVDGCEMDVGGNLSMGYLEKLIAGLIGLWKAGVNALRNSV